MYLVSVIIPCFNRLKTIERAIESVRLQTYVGIEIIVVDDCSTDGTMELLKETYGGINNIILLSNDVNKGVSYSRNRGVEYASGELIAFLDSDDYWLEEKLKKQIDYIVCNGGIDSNIVTTRTKVIYNRKTEILPKVPYAGQSMGEYLFLQDGFSQVSGILVSKNNFLKYPFRINLTQYEDYAFVIEQVNGGLSYLVYDEPLTIWDNTSRAGRLSNKDTPIMGEKFLETVKYCVSDDHQLAFRVKMLGPALFYSETITVLGWINKAYSKRLINSRRVIKLLIKCLVYRLL